MGGEDVTTERCIQMRNSGAGFVKEHGTLCAFDPSRGIDHGLASWHLNLGRWCGNICEKCATAKGKYRPEQLTHGIYQAVIITGPRMAKYQRPKPKQQPVVPLTEEENEDNMAKKSTKKKSTKRGAGLETSETTDAEAKELIKRAKKEGVSQAPSTLARWFRTQGKAMSGNRMAKLLEAS